MSNEEASIVPDERAAQAEPTPAEETQTPIDAEPTAASELSDASEAPELREPVETAHAPVEVGLQRSVRVGRIVIIAAMIGAIIGVGVSLFFPVVEGAQYELRQVAGLMAVVGAAIGLSLGAILALLLGIVARRNRGAAIAVQTDVR